MFSGIPRDKWKHFFVGLALGLLLEAFALYYLPHHRWAGTAVIVGIIAALSYGFELYSLVTKKGHYDVMDAVAGIVGGMVGILILVASFCLW